MRIVLAVPGHLRTVPMGRFAAEALRELGHDVALFDYAPTPLDKVRERLPWRSAEEKAAVNRRLRRSIEEARPDLFLTLFGFDVSRESLQWMRGRDLPSACWWINDPFQFQRSVRKAPYYDFVFSNSCVCPSQYLQAGAPHAYFLPTACAPGVHRPRPPEERYRSEVCFAADWSALRERMVEPLVGRFRVRLFGPWSENLAPPSPLRAP